MTVKKFNINNYVKVKLTDYGREIHKKHHIDLFTEIGKLDKFPYETLKEDEYGYVTFQLHDLMKLFGEYFGAGGRPEQYPFKFDILFKEDDLKEVIDIKVGDYIRLNPYALSDFDGDKYDIYEIIDIIDGDKYQLRSYRSWNIPKVYVSEYQIEHFYSHPKTKVSKVSND